MAKTIDESVSLLKFLEVACENVVTDPLTVLAGQGEVWYSSYNSNNYTGISVVKERVARFSSDLAGFLRIHQEFIDLFSKLSCETRLRTASSFVDHLSYTYSKYVGLVEFQRAGGKYNFIESFLKYPCFSGLNSQLYASTDVRQDLDQLAALQDFLSSFNFNVECDLLHILDPKIAGASTSGPKGTPHAFANLSYQARLDYVKNELENKFGFGKPVVEQKEPSSESILVHQLQ